MRKASSEPKAGETIGSKVVAGSMMSLSASVVTLVLGLLRAVLLARFLQPEEFGLAVMGLFFLELVLAVQDAGLGAAYIRNSKDGRDGLFTFMLLRFSFLIISLAIFVVGIRGFGGLFVTFDGLENLAWAFALVGLLRGINGVQEAEQRRQMTFKTLAMANILASITMTIVAPWLAYLGWGVWALVYERLSAGVIRFVVLWTRPSAWRFPFQWRSSSAKQMLRFGSSVWIGGLLQELLRRLDDLLIGMFLGGQALGMYSRAYEFAQFPQRVLGTPLFVVLYPAFAKLKDDRDALTATFFRASAGSVRLGGLWAVMFVLPAKEGIEIVLGSNWLGMALAFQILALSIWVSPVSGCAHQMLTAIGHPKIVIGIRIVELLVLVPGLLVLTPMWGMEGGALAVGLSMLLGLGVSYGYVRKRLEFSMSALWTSPLIALFISIMVGSFLENSVAEMSLYQRFAIKLLGGSGLYVAFLLIVERRRLIGLWKKVRT